MKRKIISAFSLISFTIISAIFLLVIGVSANETIKPRLLGVFSPDIYCKIEIQDGNWETIFLNKDNSSFFDDDFCSVDGNTITISKTASGEVASELDFRITNYSNDKHIQASIEKIYLNGNEQNSNEQNEYITTSSNFVVAEKFDAIPTVSDELKVFVAANKKQTTNKLEIQLRVQEVFKVTFEDSNGELTNPTTYITDQKDQEIKLLPSCGSKLPVKNTLATTNDLVVSRNGETLNESSSNEATTHFTYRENNGTIEFPQEQITNDFHIVCNTTTVYKIKQYADGEAPSNNESGEKLRFYNYYVEMGTYPQSYVGDATQKKLLDMMNNPSDYPNEKLEVQSDLKFYKDVAKSSSLIFKKTSNIYKYTNKTTGEEKLYARSQVVANPSSNDSQSFFFSDGTQVIGMRFFNIEPIRWTVIGVDQHSSISFDDLHFKDGQFFTDIACTQKYTGGILVYSETALDVNSFSSNSYFGSGGSLYDFLNGAKNPSQHNNGTTHSVTISGVSQEITTFAHLSGLQQYFSTSSIANNNYIKLETLTTYGANENVTLTNYTSTCNIFPLAASTTDNKTNEDNQTYIANDYFNIVETDNIPDGFASSVGATVASDFCMTETPFISGDERYIRSWGGNSAGKAISPSAGTTIVNTHKTSSYTLLTWTRTGDVGSITLSKIQIFIPAFSTGTSGNNLIGVRPAFVLDLGYSPNGN